jgi:hypothetical protein
MPPEIAEILKLLNYYYLGFIGVRPLMSVEMSVEIFHRGLFQPVKLKSCHEAFIGLIYFLIPNKKGMD